MAEDSEQREPTQPTQPKGRDKHGKPYEPVQIPVPKVSTFRAAIRRVARPQSVPKRPQQSGMRGKGGRRPSPQHSAGRRK
jgi:hypothetical protein